MQVASHLTGTTAHVTHFVVPGDLSCETIEEFSIKRLVLKFVENSACIFARELIVGFANRSCDVVVHRGSAGYRQQKLPLLLCHLLLVAHV